MTDTLFPEIWGHTSESAAKLSPLSVEVLADWPVFAPLLRHLRQAEVRTLGEVCLLRADDISHWPGVGPIRVRRFVRLIEHLQEYPEAFFAKAGSEEQATGTGEVFSLLEKVDISMLATQKEYATLVRKLQQGGVNNLARLCTLRRSRLEQMPGMGRKNALRLAALRLEILGNWDGYLKQWHTYCMQNAYPLARFDAPLTAARMESELADLMRALEKCWPQGKLVRMYFLDGNEPEAIAATAGMNAKQLREICEHHFFNAIISGRTVCGFSLRPTFLAQMEELRRQLMYGPATAVGKLSRMPLSRFLRFLRLTSMPLPEQAQLGNMAYLVPEGEEAVASSTARILSDELQHHVMPAPAARLLAAMAGKNGQRRSPFSEAMARGLLDTHPWVERDEAGGYRLAARHLRIEPYRVARIVIDAYRPIAVADIEKRYTSLYGSAPAQLNLTAIHRHVPGVMPTDSADLWQWLPAGSISLPEVGEVIPALIARLNYEFHFDDMRLLLKRMGYRGLPDATLHTHLTRWCSRDNADMHHYCHKDHLAEHGDHQWRRVRRPDAGQLVLRQVMRLLKSAPRNRLPLEDVLEEMRAWTRLTGRRVRDLRAVIFGATAAGLDDGVGRNLPFYLNSNNLVVELCLNPPVARRILSR